jgi:hypothetical protein
LRYRPKKKKICIFCEGDDLVDDSESESERRQNTTVATPQEANIGASEPLTRGQPGQSGIVPGFAQAAPTTSWSLSEPYSSAFIWAVS